MAEILSNVTANPWALLLLLLAGYVLGAFSRPFLTEAAKDFYHGWFASKILRRKSRINDLPSNALVPVNQAPIPNAPSERVEAKVERIHRITYQEISAAYNNAPPLQRPDISKSYEGIRVQWEGEFSSAWHSGENYRISIRVPPGRFSQSHARGEVPAESYPELRTIREDQPVRITGTIAKVESYSVELSDIDLEILHTPG
jgi:hypothetical protein